MPEYVVEWTARVIITAECAADAIDAVGANVPTTIGITVDSHEFNPFFPPGCTAQTFGGTLETPPEFCEGDVVRWDEHGDPWCANHQAQPDDGQGE